MLSALAGLRNSRAFAGFSLETLMVRGRNGRVLVDGAPCSEHRIKAQQQREAYAGLVVDVACERTAHPGLVVRSHLKG